MARRRLALALLVPEPVATEVDALRRALGDRQLDRIAPHLTIVPPINLADDLVADGLAVAAAAVRGRHPISVTLGPVDTFSEASPVRFLAVDPWHEVEALWASCWTGPFERPVTRPFHPHVTVDLDGGPTTGPDPAIDLLAGYRAEVVFDRLTVLEHVVDEDGPHWATYLSYRFG